MALDSKDWDRIVAKSANQVNESLAPEISSLTRMKDSEIEEFFPTPSDKQKLASLMAIVTSADDENTKIRRIVDNIEDLAGVVVTLAGKVV